LENKNNLQKAKHAIEVKQYSQAEQYLLQWLKLNENDWDAKFLLARVYAWQNKTQKSHDMYDELLSRYPENSDYLLGKAQTYLWDDNPKPALPLLSRARRISPDYREVWRLELQTLRELPDETSQTLYKTLLEQSQQRFAGENWLIAFTDDRNKSTRCNTMLGVERRVDKLSDHLPSWYSYGIEAIHKCNMIYTLYSTIHTIKRFDQKDQEFDLDTQFNINPNWFFRIGASYSPSYKVIAHRSFDLYVGLNFLDGYNVQIGNMIRNYKYVDTSSSNIIIERYLENYRLRYTIHFITIDGKNLATESELSHSIDIAYYYTQISSIALSLAKGKELEYNGSTSALITDITNISIYGTHWFRNSNWAPKYNFEYQKQGKYYSRYGFNFGLLYQF